jgi:uncharacterized protein YuzE
MSDPHTQTVMAYQIKVSLPDQEGQMSAEPELKIHHIDSLRYTYDRSVDALYVYLPGDVGTPVAQTRELDESRTLDLDAIGRVVGIELLSPVAIGIDVTDLPHAADLVTLARQMGFAVHGAHTTGPS